MQLQNKKAKKKVLTPRFIAYIGIFSALALALSIFENMLPPLPMMPPGAKLGLSNIVTMYAASALGFLPALFITLIKGVFAAITRGTVAMLMSLSGGILSTVIMYICLKSKKLGYVGIGIISAFSHNLGQLIMAYFITSKTIVWYAPWLIVFSIITGTLTGIMLKTVMPLFKKINRE